MPTYQNQTDRRITWGHKHYIEFDPGETKALRYFIPEDITGLTMIDVEPYVLRNRNIMLDYTEIMIEPSMTLAERTVKIPWVETVLISVEVRSGEVKMYVGDSEIPIIVDRDNNHVSIYPWDISSYLVFEVEEATAVYMKFEPYTHRGTERRP